MQFKVVNDRPANYDPSLVDRRREPRELTILRS